MLNIFKGNQKEIRIILTLFLSVFFASLMIFIMTGYTLPSENSFNAEYISINTFFVILKNNLFVFTLLALGTVTFGILTYVNIITNATIIAMAFFWAFNVNMKFLFFLVHGIPEFISFFLASIIGLKRISQHYKEPKPFLRLLITGILFVLVGAILETYVSPLIFST